MPLLIVTNAMSNLARADGSPKYSMTVAGGRGYQQHDPDPIFIFVFSLGVAGAAPGLRSLVSSSPPSCWLCAMPSASSHSNLGREHLRLSLVRAFRPVLSA